jgi:hypothetical protein
MHKSIFKTPESSIRLQRNAFDLSRRNLFTASAGQLLPCLTIECNPNEHYEINPTMFLRTQTLNTAAFARMKQSVEFFFVPYRLLMSRYRQFIMGTDYPTSSMISGMSPSKLPHFNLYNTTKDLTSATALKGFVDYLQYGTPDTDIHGYDYQAGSLRLLDLLGYGVHKNGTSIATAYQANTTVVTPFRLLAYQKIFNDFYRLPLYESVDVNSFNIDDVVANSDGNVDMMNSSYTITRNGKPYTANTPWYRLNRCAQLRYRPWKRDYFTNVRPTFAGAEFVSLDVSAPLMPSTNTITFEQHASESGFQSILSSSNGSTGNFGFSISNLRSAFALDKLLDLTQRAKDGSYAAQVSAHFGFNVQTDSSKCRYLGGQDSVVTIGEVTSTADTSTAPLAKIAGKGVSNIQGNITFDTPEHGIIMGIYSVLPECEYNCDGTARELTKTSREQFFVPEFDSLGYQPTFGYELDNQEKFASATTVLGYNTRYSEYKTAVDEVHGEFKRSGSLNAWSSPRPTNYSLANGINAHFLLVDPSVLNSIFAIQYNGKQNTDQFLINSFFNVSAIRPMSVAGLPNLN